MFPALKKAIRQLSDPRFRAVVIKSVLIALVLYVLLYAALVWGLSATAVFTTGWLETMADILGGALVFVLSILLFPAIIGTVIGFWLDDIVAAVEEKHYPNLPAPRPQGIGASILQGLKFGAVLIGLNLIAIPFYLVPVLNLAVFYVLNGYLLSREYFELVAFRRLDPAKARALRRTNQGYLWLGGVAIAFLFSIPIVNLIAPVIAAAFMVHLFESLRRRAAGV